MTLGRKDFSVTRTDGGADVFRLARFLRDDELIDHNASFRRIDLTAAYCPTARRFRAVAPSTR